MKKVVLIRLDKIGDLVSTLPSDQLDFVKDADVTWVIANGLGFIPQNSEPRRKFLELDRGRAKHSFWQLVDFLKRSQPELAVSFQAPWWVSLALFWARVPVRVGVLSQWHSFFFLNKTLRQKRSKARQHEADYNSDLLAFAFDQKIPTGQKSPVLKLLSPNKIEIKKWNLAPEQFVVVHPGMAGSALNWSTENYMALIGRLLEIYKVALTGTAADEPWLTDIKTKFQSHPNFVNLQSGLDTEQLLSLLAQAKLVVAPSTGVAHLSAALGRPTFGIYSPIRVQHPRRWGARGPQSLTFMPEVPCPADFKCLGTSCKFFYCMDQISVKDILKKIQEIK